MVKQFSYDCELTQKEENTKTVFPNKFRLTREFVPEDVQHMFKGSVKACAPDGRPIKKLHTLRHFNTSGACANLKPCGVVILYILYI